MVHLEQANCDDYSTVLYNNYDIVAD